MKKATPKAPTSGKPTSIGGQPRATRTAALPGGEAMVAAPPMAAGPLPPTPRTDGDPITDVNSLSVVSPGVAAKIKAAAGFVAGALAMRGRAEAAQRSKATKPGVERWPVKTGRDQDRAKVGKNVIGGENLGAGIVESTVEELGSLPRPPGMENPEANPPQFKGVRDGVVEVTIWRIEADILGILHEADGDYHLRLSSRVTPQPMVAEIPRPDVDFIGGSPWFDNIGAARQEVDDKIVRHLSPAAFSLVQGTYMPHGATMSQSGVAAGPEVSFLTPPPGVSQPLFQAATPRTGARITGVGFFDHAHAGGAAPNVIELHPVLKIEWL